MRLKHTLVIATVAVAVAASFALVAGPAAGGELLACAGNADTAPDGKINVNGGPFVGAGEYPKRTLDESPVVGGQQATFLLKWKNLTEIPRTIRVERGVFSNNGDTVTKYFVNGVNVSRTVRQEGRLVFRGVQPGKRATLEVVLKNRSGGASTAWTTMHGRYGGSAQESCDALLPVIND